MPRNDFELKKEICTLVASWFRDVRISDQSFGREASMGKQTHCPMILSRPPQLASHCPLALQTLLHPPDPLPSQALKPTQAVASCSARPKHVEPLIQLRAFELCRVISCFVRMLLAKKLLSPYLQPLIFFKCNFLPACLFAPQYLQQPDHVVNGLALHGCNKTIFEVLAAWHGRQPYCAANHAFNAVLLHCFKTKAFKDIF